jgi:hypothetical protein
MQAFTEALFEAAQRGDPRVVSQGVVADEYQASLDGRRPQVSDRQSRRERDEAPVTLIRLAGQLLDDERTCVVPDCGALAVAEPFQVERPGQG